MGIVAGLFVATWLFGVAGWFVAAFEWRAFERGRPSGASTGYVLLSRRLAKAESTEALVGAYSPWRVVSSSIALCPLGIRYARSSESPWRLPWFGHAVLEPDAVRLEARIPAGQMMFAGAWVAMALIMAGMALWSGSIGAGLGLFLVGSVAIVGLTRTVIRERGAAAEFFASVAPKV